MKTLKYLIIKHEWTIVSSLIVISITLGLVGSRIYLLENDLYFSFFDALYLTLKLFFFAFAQQFEVHWTLQIARFAAPLTLWYAAAKTFFLLAHEKISMMKLKNIKNHTIVCGLGEMSFSFVSDMLQSGEKVVVIQRENENHFVQSCKDKGAFVIEGSDFDATALQKSGIQRAKNIVCLDDDVSNITAAIVAHRTARKVGHQNNISCHIHISKLNTLSDLNDIDFFTEIQLESKISNASNRKQFELLPFNFQERAARIIYSKYSPDVFSPINIDSPQPHVIIVGFNQLGKSILLQAARMSHFANQKKLKVTVLEKGASAVERMFEKAYPQLSHVIDFSVKELNLDNFDANEFKKLQGDVPVVCSYLCLDEDKFSVSYIRLIIPLMKDKSHVIICTKNSDNVFSMMPKRYQKQIHRFLLFDETCTRKAIVNETVDDLAKAIHNDYISKQKEAGTFNPTKKASHQEWNTLSQNFKDQNRSQADNIMIKVRAIGGRLTSQKTSIPEYHFTGNKDIVELLAMMEHHRWCAHLWLNGWQYGEVRNDANKIHTDLIPYDQLSEPVKQYDRDAIVNLPALLFRLGKKIVKDS